MARRRLSLPLLWAALGLSLSVGILGRGYWTPDEPREADIAWRMSWQADKAVPLLAGEAFCEKPPFTYWASGAAIAAWGADAWVARLPNLVYALVTALAVGGLGRRAAGGVAGAAAAAAISTLLLSYQVAIWLATDAPLLASVAVAMLGLFVGYYPKRARDRLSGYSAMHAALAVGFLSKSAAAWMVPVLTLATLILWERRWRELLRWELYVGLLVQAALILGWVWLVYVGPDGAAHLKVFFWNNLAGRFTQVDAPDTLQYAAAHRNSPGKYLIELPVYLWPWTLLTLAAARAAWMQRRAAADALRPVRFAVAAFVPTLAVLSVAATARNIYLAPALPGIALLLGWWACRLTTVHDVWDLRAIRATALLLGIAAAVIAVALLCVVPVAAAPRQTAILALGVLGVAASAAFAVSGWRSAGRGRMLRSLLALTLAYCTLLIGPASLLYRRIDAWQDLASIGRAIGMAGAGRPLILVAPDETTRAFIDMYARTSVEWVPGPVSVATRARLDELLAGKPRSMVVVQLPGRGPLAMSAAAERFGAGRLFGSRAVDSIREPDWAAAAGLHAAQVYALPNGRRYALLEAVAAVDK